MLLLHQWAFLPRSIIIVAPRLTTKEDWWLLFFSGSVSSIFQHYETSQSGWNYQVNENQDKGWETQIWAEVRRGGEYDQNALYEILN